MITFQTMSKPVMSLYKPDDTRKLCSFKVHNELLGDLNLETRKYSDGFNNFITELKNRCGKVLGSETFNMEKDGQDITGLYITVEPEYRKKSFKFGEILRLSSIIEMLENKAPAIDIYSKDTAVYFHSKYKFVPNMQAFYERDHALQSIIKNPSKGFESIMDYAKEILAGIAKATTVEEQRELRTQANMLAELYIQEVMKTKDLYKNHPIDSGMKMQLTKEAVLNNKDFFNALFKKHGIDYQIR